MIKKSQSFLKSKYTFKALKIKTPKLFGCPQKRGETLKILKQNPKKPNSADRAVAFVKVFKKKKTVFAYIPGISHNISTHTSLLYRGGLTQDLPRMRYKVVRGALNVSGVVGRTKARSKYGSRRVFSTMLF